MIIGTNSKGEPIELTDSFRRMTHMHMIGGSQTGKTSAVEDQARECVLTGQGCTVFCWHHQLYEHLLRFLAYVRPARDIILIDPSKAEHIVGFNPFLHTSPHDMFNALLRVWGDKNSDDTPRMERLCRMIFEYGQETGEPLQHVAHLLDFPKVELRELAIKQMTNPYVRGQWSQMQYVTTLKDWRYFTESTENRLMRLLGSPELKRFIGMKEGNIDPFDVMDNEKIVLVNLAANGTNWSVDQGHAFAALFLHSYFGAAMMRAVRKEPPLHLLFLDEFQNYFTPDLAAMLDQVLKGGLHLILAHHHFGQLAKDEHLVRSILSNARIRVAFRGVDYDITAKLVNEMFLSEVNKRQVSNRIYHTVTKHREETRVVSSDGVSAGHDESEATGHTTYDGLFIDWRGNATNHTTGRRRNIVDTSNASVVPFLMPYYEQELSSEETWSREEKVSHIVEYINRQPERHCAVQLDIFGSHWLTWNYVEECFPGKEAVRETELGYYRKLNAPTRDEADRLIGKAEQDFINQSYRLAEADDLEPAPIRAKIQKKIADNGTGNGSKPRRKKPTPTERRDEE